MHNVEELRNELVALFARNGGVNKVAAKSGLNSQRLRYVASGRSMIKTDAIMAIVGAYPEERRLRELMGIPTLTPVGVAADGDDFSTSAYIARLEAEIEGYKRENEGLKKQVEQLWRIVAPKLQPELNFLTASSQTTGIDLINGKKAGRFIAPNAGAATPATSVPGK